MWTKILSTVSKYGPKAVKWAWSHKWELMNMGDMAIRYINQIWG